MAWKRPLDVFKDIDENWCPELIVLPSGSFLMGSPPEESGREEYEGPQHAVMLSHPFALGRYAVTFEQYRHFCEDTEHDYPGDGGWNVEGRPVADVSYLDAQKYCAWLSGKTGTTYRLPTEAMWEYACRAGTTTPFNSGQDIATSQANFVGQPEGFFRGLTSPVGSFAPNLWGLYEMHGNVCEWCADWYGPYTVDAATDPEGPLKGSKRIMRGGSYLDVEKHVRSAFRFADVPFATSVEYGFRCARLLALDEVSLKGC